MGNINCFGESSGARAFFGVCVFENRNSLNGVMNEGMTFEVGNVNASALKIYVLRRVMFCGIIIQNEMGTLSLPFS